MKKKLAAALAAITLLISGSAMADPVTIDLSTMSLDDLTALQQQVNAAMWASDEWQSVQVPEGVYLVGRDIPAGHWSIKVGDTQDIAILIGKTPNENMTKLSPPYDMWLLTGKDHKWYDEDDRLVLDAVLNDGDWVSIEFGYAVFEPSTGVTLNFVWNN